LAVVEAGPFVCNEIGRAISAGAFVHALSGSRYGGFVPAATAALAPRAHSCVSARKSLEGSFLVVDKGRFAQSLDRRVYTVSREVAHVMVAVLLSSQQRIRKPGSRLCRPKQCLRSIHVEVAEAGWSVN